ncbi:MAG TPA: recombinase family protein [Spirochaetia bacterium]|nr:recombinase family protein [Spirochaetia bacterium]
MSAYREKMQTQHLSRLALVYIRQSTLAQVRFHTESTERQYALKEKALSLGWTAEQVQVIDEDLGLSGAHKENRNGFQRLVTQVSMGQVGAIFGLEVSRLARSSADWQRLLELCALFDTMVVDEDGIYDPNDFNDRLILGFKGTMSEAELHFLRSRLIGGKKNKAKKGELRFPLPVGFCYDESGHIQLDPDQGVESAVRNVFSAFKTTGSAFGVVQTFSKNGLMFPKRAYGGAWAGKLIWGKLNHGRVLNILSNPSYAGAYCFGRFKSGKKVTADGVLVQRIVRLPQDQWEVLIFDHHPGYITWAEYEENLNLLQLNRTNKELRGPAREGACLLQGLVLCGKCGKRMIARYTSNGGVCPQYQCRWHHRNEGIAGCSQIKAKTIDDAVTSKIMEALQPAQLDLTLKALGDVQKQEQELGMTWRLSIERSQYEADRCERQFNLVDPENRLVARTLEVRWNEKLNELNSVKEDFERYRNSLSIIPSSIDYNELLTLAGNIHDLWPAETTSHKDKKRIVRLIIEDVTVTTTRGNREATIGIRWRSGRCDSLTVSKDLPASVSRKHTVDTVDLVRELSQNMTDPEITDYLNNNGFTTSEGRAFTVDGVRWIRFRYRIPGPATSQGSFTVEQVATMFKVGKCTVYYWLETGVLKGSKRGPGWPWEIIIDDPAKQTVGEKLARPAGRPRKRRS